MKKQKLKQKKTRREKRLEEEDEEQRLLNTLPTQEAQKHKIEKLFSALGRNTPLPLPEQDKARAESREEAFKARFALSTTQLAASSDSHAYRSIRRMEIQTQELMETKEKKETSLKEFEEEMALKRALDDKKTERNRLKRLKRRKDSTKKDSTTTNAS